MLPIKIEDVKGFTSQLFLHEGFDSFLLKEAQIVTFGAVSIDGRLRKGYFLTQELEELGDEPYAPWKLWRPRFFDLIKGKRLPERFLIVLQLDLKQSEAFGREFGLEKENLPSLYLNIRYEDGTLYCITGVSMNVFTLDKTIEREWDRRGELLLKKMGIAFTGQQGA